MVETLKNPKQLLYDSGEHLFVNSVDIYNVMSAAYTNYKAPEYEAFGKDVGISLAMILIGSVRPQDRKGHALLANSKQSLKKSGGDTLKFTESNKPYVDYLEKVVI